MTLKVSFEEALQGVEKKVQFQKDVKCHSCNGSREATGSKSSPCYGCKGEGLKRDPLFKKEQKCNTCQGHGFLTVNPCK